MNVRNCRKCGRIFNYVMGPHICPGCREALEADFQRVKEFVREHPGATITMVSEECEVDISQIHQWLREERLELTDGAGIILQCETCGAVIRCGRYCEQCKRNLTMGLKEAVKGSQSSEPEGRNKTNRDGDKMRYLHR